ncbi:MAG: hypothetical protein ABEI74_02230 [Candidatus Pacearchaeota archaeon]
MSELEKEIFESSKSSSREWEKIKAQKDNLRKILTNTYDELTKGAYSNERNLNNLAIHLSSSNKTRSRPFLSLFSKSVYEGEKGFRSIWLATGESHWGYDPNSPLFVFGNKNKNMREIMESLWEFNKKNIFKDNEEAINELLEHYKFIDKNGDESYLLNLPDD